MQQGISKAKLQINHGFLPFPKVQHRILGIGVKPHPLELDISQNFITWAKEINCFSILFAC